MTSNSFDSGAATKRQVHDFWNCYALLAGRPWLTLSDIYASRLESPGTEAYTVSEAHELLERFSHVDVETLLTHDDLLTSGAGQRHLGPLLRIARMISPSRLIRALMPSHGLFLLARALK
jgi:hypothetical protein